MTTPGCRAFTPVVCTMKTVESEPTAEGRATIPAAVNTRAELRLGDADRSALREIFRSLCLFAAYLVVVGICGSVFDWGRLLNALLQFIPFCFLLTAVAHGGRRLARVHRPTLLMGACLVCVFLVLGFDVTKNLSWLNGVPILGRDSHVRNDIASIALIVAVASFPAASYYMLQEILLANQELDEKVEELEDALRHVRRLQGLLPICMWCHRIRNDKESWERIELYISEHSDARFTHGLCPDCAREHYPGLGAQKPGDESTGAPSANGV